MSSQFFQSDNASGYSAAVRAMPGCRPARKRGAAVSVRFARAHALIATLEGQVPAHPGDAIVTGRAGEQWPVPSARFAARYQAVAPTRQGEDGNYLSLPIDVLAVRMETAFAVPVAGGEAQLTGRPGDWLIDYGDGALGVVAAAIFTASYDLMEAN